MVLLISFSSFSQKFTTNLSEPFESKLTTKYFKSGDGYVTFEDIDNKMQLAYTFKLSKTKFGIRLRSFNSSMEMIKENKLEGGDRHFGPFPTTMVRFGDTLYLVYYRFDDDKDEVVINSAKLDPVSLELGPEKPIMRFDIQNIGAFKVVKLNNGFNFWVNWSPDRSKALAYFSSGIDNRFTMAVMDQGMNPIWSRTETISQTKEIDCDAAVVDNDGVVYVSYQYEVKKDPNSHHVMVCKAKGKGKDFEMTAPSGTPYQVLLVPSKLGNFIHVVGTVGSEDGLTGVFRQQYSIPGSRLDKMQITDFSNDLVSQLDHDGWANTKSKRYGLSFLKMKAFELEDGSIAMAGEFEETRTSNTPSSSGGFRSFHISGSILNIRLGTGNPVVNWIPKVRVSAGALYGASYYAFPFKNNLFIFYNDEARNLNKEVGEKYARSSNYKNVSLIAGYMQADGSIKRELLIDLSNDDFLPEGDAISPVSSSSLLVPITRIKSMGGKAKDSRWGVINIE